MSIYLDNNSTTSVDPIVLETMLPFFTKHFGNAASKTHSYGFTAAEAVKIAREKIASTINCEPNEVIFTSGATEAINLALKGIAEAYTVKGKHIVTVSTEHKAVLDTCKSLEEKGFEITILPVMSDGLIDLQLLEKIIRPDTILVNVMLANNETGIIQPIRQISEIVHSKNSILFSDTTQALGKIRVDVNEMGIDVACFSAHKVYGPKGVGALFIRRKNPRVTVYAQIHGGGHERGLRSGTLNVPGIVGFGKACEIAYDNYFEETGRISILRSKFEQALTEYDSVSVNGNLKSRLPNTSNLCFHHYRSSDLIKALPQIAFSAGSACTSALPEPSHVLKAMGLSDEAAFSSLRFSFGRFNSEEEMAKAVELFRDITQNKS